jgi:hypothetical protein
MQSAAAAGSRRWRIVDGAPERDSRECAVEHELAGGGLPGIGQHVEGLVQAALGMGSKLRGVLRGRGVDATRLAGGAALLPVDGAAPRVALVDVAHDRGEVAIADARLAAARVGADAALGVAEVVERAAGGRRRQ